MEAATSSLRLPLYVSLFSTINHLCSFVYETKLMEFNVRMSFLGTVAPLAAYWLYYGFYVLFGSLDIDFIQKTTKQIRIWFQRRPLSKVFFSNRLFKPSSPLSFSQYVTGSDDDATTNKNHSLFDLAREFFKAVVVIDTWQYFMHRYMHQNKSYTAISIPYITASSFHTHLELFTIIHLLDPKMK
ncbi:hypothetical protein LXL04_028059 [Taraxacum kok-saghyz]